MEATETARLQWLHQTKALLWAQVVHISIRRPHCLMPSEVKSIVKDRADMMILKNFCIRKEKECGQYRDRVISHDFCYSTAVL